MREKVNGTPEEMSAQLQFHHHGTPMAALKEFDCNDIMIFLVTMHNQTIRTLKKWYRTTVSYNYLTLTT